VNQPKALLLLAVLCTATTHADNSLTVAVASNFRATAQEIAQAFTHETGVPVLLSSGSTGKLYAQIVNGAPFDIFLAADIKRPRMLEESGVAVKGSLLTYAKGKLVLISTEFSLKGQSCSEALNSGSYRKIAIANPETAPYGAAAKAYLQTAGLWEDAKSRMVIGENILQTFQFVATGNATLGFVAAAQLAIDSSPEEITCRSEIDVPETDIVYQAGVILDRTEYLDDARSFMSFLQSAEARALMSSQGYEAAEH